MIAVQYRGDTINQNKIHLEMFQNREFVSLENLVNRDENDPNWWKSKSFATLSVDFQEFQKHTGILIPRGLGGIPIIEELVVVQVLELEHLKFPNPVKIFESNKSFMDFCLKTKVYRINSESLTY